MPFTVNGVGFDSNIESWDNTLWNGTLHSNYGSTPRPHSFFGVILLLQASRTITAPTGFHALGATTLASGNYKIAAYWADDAVVGAGPYSFSATAAGTYGELWAFYESFTNVSGFDSFLVDAYAANTVAVDVVRPSMSGYGIGIATASVGGIALDSYTTVRTGNPFGSGTANFTDSEAGFTYGGEISTATCETNPVAHVVVKNHLGNPPASSAWAASAMLLFTSTGSGCGGGGWRVGMVT